MTLKILTVIAGLGSSDGGVSYSVPRLCRALAEAGAMVWLYSVAGREGARHDAMASNLIQQQFPWDWPGLPFVGAMRRSVQLDAAMTARAHEIDVIHNHGIWLHPNMMAGEVASKSGKPLVISPRGMLSPAAMGFSRWKKSIVWYLGQGNVLRDAACLHVTSRMEYEDVRALGLANPVAVIPNGIDVPEFEAVLPSPPDPNRTVLFIGRLHPKKGLDRLLKAWAAVEPIYADWSLRIIGPDERGHANELVALANKLALRRVHIGPEVEGDEKWSAYRHADLFVMPTLSENFGLTVAESLASGTPVICTKGAPWDGLEREGCGWWIDHGPEPLAAALRSAMAMSRQQLKTMGARGTAWMRRSYSWDAVAHDMIEVYRWVAEGGVAPPSVVLD